MKDSDARHEDSSCVRMRARMLIDMGQRMKILHARYSSCA